MVFLAFANGKYESSFACEQSAKQKSKQQIECKPKQQYVCMWQQQVRAMGT